MTQAPRMAEEFLSTFEALERDLPGAGIGWIRELRRQALDALAQPEWLARAWQHDEFTGLSLEAAAFRPAAFGARSWLDPDELSPQLVRAVGASTLVFLDGQLSEALTARQPPLAEVEVGSLCDALRFAREDLREHLGRQLTGPQRPFVPLNTAFMSDGAVIRVRAGETVHQPLQLLFISTGPAGALATHPRVLIILEPGSRATVVQSFNGTDDRVYLTNAVTEMVVQEGATLELVVLQNESSAAFHHWSGAAELASGAQLLARSLLIGGAVSSEELQVVLQGTGARANLQAFVHAAGQEHAALSSSAAHEGPRTVSTQKLRAWLDGSATATLRPSSVVAQRADGAVAERETSAVLASSEASVRASPEMSAVGGACRSIGSTAVHPLDSASVLALQAGGLTERQARSRLALKLAEEIAGAVSSPALVTELLQTLDERLSRFRT